ncbi:23S rRNA (guanosine(2251)-2'-O)-methyltransferase RlmB [Cardinium endosymbiont of Culicoides punctatus]|uniref:23S rRNA (guanosine(2251)-2'-O)-methyltransferase RlmB n=1 Tax=Cardinium endosymbiont of Culicoides punctatus TaxID=2304601 RepID=UPI001058B581|nr:23S rRNA (guanosine(2251)-2'-O)-methyltransferase RlmB [Cardinium endosymbiont of Culicoides punctatus]TDG93070.1 putative TrmH family tRNA/rRNA methyltransferase [Cardinium endosymbiont of Culicoides punctatus]
MSYFFAKNNRKKTTTHQQSLIFGSRAVMETILAGRTIEKIFLQRALKTPLAKELYDLICKYEIPFSYVPTEKLSRLSHGNHQGVVAIISPIAFAPLEVIIQNTFEKGKIPLILILDGVTDVHNLGAIARTALCMGVDALVIPSHRSASVSGAAMKTSAGALSMLPVCRVASLKVALQYLQESGLAIFACHEKASQELYTSDLRLPAAIILGGEDSGIAVEHLNLATYQIKIPIRGPIASLNVSVATGMILYEVLRQRLL